MRAALGAVVYGVSFLVTVGYLLPTVLLIGPLQALCAFACYLAFVVWEHFRPRLYKVAIVAVAYPVLAHLLGVMEANATTGRTTAISVSDFVPYLPTLVIWVIALFLLHMYLVWPYLKRADAAKAVTTSQAAIDSDTP